MADKLKQNKGQPKKPYLKPEVTQVPLRPEEAVLGVCKSTGAGGGPVSDPCSLLNCTQMGS